MSRENVEVVRQVFDAVARHDPESVLALYDPAVVFDFSQSPVGDFLGRKVYRGHEGVRGWTRDRYEAWATIEDTYDELIEAGGQVVSVVTTHGRGRASGVEVDLHHAGVWTLRDGKIVRVAWFFSREEALQTAGLRESGS